MQPILYKTPRETGVSCNQRVHSSTYFLEATGCSPSSTHLSYFLLLFHSCENSSVSFQEVEMCCCTYDAQTWRIALVPKSLYNISPNYTCSPKKKKITKNPFLPKRYGSFLSAYSPSGKWNCITMQWNHIMIQSHVYKWDWAHQHLYTSSFFSILTPATNGSGEYVRKNCLTRTGCV